MSKTKYTVEEKLKVIEEKQKGKTYTEIAKEYGIHKSDIEKWYTAYEEHGLKGIQIRKHNLNRYTGQFKVNVVQYKKEAGVSARQTASKFNIPSFRSVIQWEQIYDMQGAAGLLEERRGRCTAMENPAKGRKHKEVIPSKEETLEEEIQRLRMENDCLKKLNALVLERQKQQQKKKRS